MGLAAAAAAAASAPSKKNDDVDDDAAAKKSHEFLWTATVEPHAARRKAILAAHGDEVRKLYGYDVSTAVQVRGQSKKREGAFSRSRTSDKQRCRAPTSKGEDASSFELASCSFELSFASSLCGHGGGLAVWRLESAWTSQKGSDEGR